MTVASQTTKVIYEGNSAATRFAVPFNVCDIGHICCRIVSHYGESEVSNYRVETDKDNNRALVYPAMGGKPLPAGSRLLIYRRTPQDQETDLVEGGPFHAEVHESAFDKACMQIQELQEQVDRAITVDMSDPNPPSARELLNEMQGIADGAHASAQAAAGAAGDAGQAAQAAEQNAGNAAACATAAEQYMDQAKDAAANAIGVVLGGVPVATAATNGIGRPDGTSITIDPSGKYSAISAPVPVATAATNGIGRPDGTTIKINASGQYSLAGGGGFNTIVALGSSCTYVPPKTGIYRVTLVGGGGGGGAGGIYSTTSTKSGGQGGWAGGNSYFGALCANGGGGGGGGVGSSIGVSGGGGGAYGQTVETYVALTAGVGVSVIVGAGGAGGSGNMGNFVPAGGNGQGGGLGPGRGGNLLLNNNLMQAATGGMGAGNGECGAGGAGGLVPRGGNGAPGFQAIYGGGGGGGAGNPANALSAGAMGGMAGSYYAAAGSDLFASASATMPGGAGAAGVVILEYAA